MSAADREPAPDWAVIAISQAAELLSQQRELLDLLRAQKGRRPRPPSKYRLLRWKKITDAMSEDQPMTYKEVAALAGLKADGQIRADLRALRAQGKITKVSGVWGYVLSPKPSAGTNAGDAS